MPRPLTTALRPQMIASLLCALLFSGCFNSRTYKVGVPYWEVESERPVGAMDAQSAVNAMDLSSAGVATQPGWGELTVTDDGLLRLDFPERQVCIFKMESAQYQDFEFRRGWKADTALWGYIVGGSLAIASLVELGLSTTAPPSAMVDNNDTISVNFTKEDKLLSAGVLGGVGGALVATATTALSLQYLDQADTPPRATRTRFLLREDCADGHEMPLIAQTSRGMLLLEGAGEAGTSARRLILGVEEGGLSVAPFDQPAQAGAEIVSKQGLVTAVSSKEAETGDLDATWLVDLLSRPLTAWLFTKVHVGLPDNPSAPLHAPWDAPQRVVLEVGDEARRGALIRTLASRGVTVNRPKRARLSRNKAGEIVLHLEASAHIASADGAEGQRLASLLSDLTHIRDKALVSSRPVWPLALSRQTESSAGSPRRHGLRMVGTSYNLSPTGKVSQYSPPDGRTVLSYAIDLESAGWGYTLSTWLRDDRTVRLEVPSSELRWILPSDERETIGTEILKAARRRTEAQHLPSLATLATLRSPAKQMGLELPGVEPLVNGLCSDTLEGPLASACKSLMTAWNARLKDYRKALVAEMAGIISTELKAAVKGFDPVGVVEESNPKEEAESYCRDILAHTETVCGKDAPLSDGGACNAAKSCIWQVMPKFKAAIAKVKAENAREAARERAEEAREAARARAEEARERAEEARERRMQWPIDTWVSKYGDDFLLLVIEDDSTASFGSYRKGVLEGSYSVSGSTIVVRIGNSTMRFRIMHRRSDLEVDHKKDYLKDQGGKLYIRKPI